MISFSTVELDGRVYDAELLAAPLRAIQARASSSDRGTDRLAVIEKALALRAQRLHGLVLARPHGHSLCSCGLLLTDAEALEDADGHLDLEQWQPAQTLVIVSGDQRASYAAVCRCGWRQRHTRLAPAHDAARDHASGTAEKTRPFGGIRAGALPGLRDRSPSDGGARTFPRRRHRATGTW